VYQKKAAATAVLARGDGRILQPRISMDRFATLPSPAASVGRRSAWSDRLRESFLRVFVPLMRGLLAALRAVPRASRGGRISIREVPGSLCEFF